jgi:hypothetical protein
MSLLRLENGNKYFGPSGFRLAGTGVTLDLESQKRVAIDKSYSAANDVGHCVHWLLTREGKTDGTPNTRPHAPESFRALKLLTGG